MEDSKLHVQLHTKYWQRCLKSLLPTQYTGNDSSRTALAFFILSALDLLGAGPSTFPPQERANIRDWILRCQHPNGGFCGSPNHRFPDAFYIDVGNGTQQMDPANLPATFFAILSLTFVGNLEGVKINECLRWLKKVQREDGSFGELVTQEGRIMGGRDMRYCYVATAVRWMLRGDAPLSEREKEADINVEALVVHLQAGQTYDGGISESSKHEAHAGYTYCAIAALSLLNRLPDSVPSEGVKESTFSSTGLTNIPETIRWLVSRQVGYPESEDEVDVEANHNPAQVKLAGVYEDKPLVPGLSLEQAQFVGFNGRCNKLVDTCYAFWVTASLDMLDHENVKLVNDQAIRRFLFEQTQHRIGGFGKLPGDPPDIYHSYLGLAALAIMNEPGIKSLDSALCISVQQKDIIKQRHKTALVRTRTYWKHGFGFSIREDDPDFEKLIASSDKLPGFMAKIGDTKSKLGEKFAA